MFEKIEIKIKWVGISVLGDSIIFVSESLEELVDGLDIINLI